MRVVVDTNVWISGLLWKGLPWCVLRLAEAKEIEIWVTPSMLIELENVLRHARLQQRRLELGLETVEMVAYATALVSLIEVVRIEPVIAVDPDDDVFVSCAMAAGARYLISGDKHLLDLAKWQDISIVTPREFLEQEFPHLLNQ